VGECLRLTLPDCRVPSVFHPWLTSGRNDMDLLHKEITEQIIGAA